MCAVVGAGMSLPQWLPVLREWIGDIFAVNDTAAYLSDNGIPSYVYTIDTCEHDTLRRAINIRGAVFASRINKKECIYNDIRIFNMLGEGPLGVEGGPSSICRSPHLFLRMGYRGIVYFGIDSCFYDYTHVTGTTAQAKSEVMVVRVNGIDYLTSAQLLLQAQDMWSKFDKHPDLLINTSGGLMKALIESKGDCMVVGVSESIRNQFDDLAKEVWNIPYTQEREKIYKYDPAQHRMA
jgi:hypothetical protein